MYYLEKMIGIGRKDSVASERLSLANLFEKHLPFKLKDYGQNLDKIRQMYADGYGMVYCVPHFSKREIPTLIAACVTQFEAMQQRPIVAPIALHQANNRVLSYLCDRAQIQLQSIVTKETKRLEHQLTEAGKRIPWEVHELGWGTKEYIDKAIEVLRAQGSVFVAPQGSRQTKLYPFDAPVMGFLDTQTRRRKLDKVGYVFTGIEMEQDIPDYFLGGLNRDIVYHFTISNVLTREQLHGIAPKDGRNLRIDDAVYSQMEACAPYAYRL